jgi:hypothetical protein
MDPHLQSQVSRVSGVARAGQDLVVSGTLFNSSPAAL